MLRSLLLAAALLGAHSLPAAEPQVQKSLVYAPQTTDRARNSLDIYAPAAAKNAPIMIFIHGGGWHWGNKSMVSEKPKGFNERGFILASIDYRMHPAVDYKAQAGDVAKAIHYLHEHASEFGGDAGQIYLMGHSAGAHLAALVATDKRYLEAEGLKLNNLKGVVLLDGAGYDIPKQIEIAGLPVLRKMYLDVFTDDVAKQKDASPITHIAKDQGIPPFLILYVATRRDGKQQSEGLGKKLTDAGVSAQVVPAQNKTHMTINRELGVKDDVPTKQVFEFLEKTRAK